MTLQELHTANAGAAHGEKPLCYVADVPQRDFIGVGRRKQEIVVRAEVDELLSVFVRPERVNTGV